MAFIGSDDLWQQSKESASYHQSKKHGSGRKPSRPFWGSVVEDCGRILISVVFVVGLAHILNDSVISGYFQGKFSKLVDQKLEDGMLSVRKDFDWKMEETDMRLKAMDELFKKVGEDNLDEMRDFARQIVRKEIERHAADGLGMADYAVVTGGGRVLRHSEQYNWLTGFQTVSGNRRISVDAEKMITPSFGEGGHCFSLKGTSGFIDIKLRAAIIPQAVTLEHVDKSVAYDRSRSSAPKDCKVFGWLQGPDDMEIGTDKMHLLTEFTYDLERSSAQTFKVECSNTINTVRLDVTSNHGKADFTCIYRFRVHGHEPRCKLE